MPTSTSTSELNVGYSGTGTVNITRGGQVSSYHSYLAYANRSAGSVSVDGAGSVWTTSNGAEIGYSGTGALKITHGGRVDSSGSSLGYYGSGTAVVDGIGSTLNCKLQFRGVSWHLWNGHVTHHEWGKSQQWVDHEQFKYSRILRRLNGIRGRGR